MSQIARNASCPCESGRKYKRCCGAARTEIDPRALSRGDMAVDDRIQEWAYANHRDEMNAALGELVGDPHGMVFGDTDTQLMASWQLNDRELAGGGTPAQRYARLAGLTGPERAIARRIAFARLALVRVRGSEPGRAIEIEDLTRGCARARGQPRGVLVRSDQRHVRRSSDGGAAGDVAVGSDGDAGPRCRT